jgi:hypothetical protein
MTQVMFTFIIITTDNPRLMGGLSVVQNFSTHFQRDVLPDFIENRNDVSLHANISTIQTMMH